MARALAAWGGRAMPERDLFPTTCSGRGWTVPEERRMMGAEASIQCLYLVTWALGSEW